MKICFPIEHLDGKSATLYGHFGSAPAFLIFDSNSNTVIEMLNSNQNHEHGNCNPIELIANQGIEVIIVNGIGANALQKLNNHGLKVMKSISSDISDNINAINNGRLTEITTMHTCKGHSNHNDNSQKNQIGNKFESRLLDN